MGLVLGIEKVAGKGSAGMHYIPSVWLAGKYLEGCSLKAYGGKYSGEAQIREDWKHYACLIEYQERKKTWVSYECLE